MATKKPRINGYKIKRFFFLLVLLAILAFFYWLVLKRVSPVFKQEEINHEANKAKIERDYRGAININPKLDYKNTTEAPKK